MPTLLQKVAAIRGALSLSPELPLVAVLSAGVAALGIAPEHAERTVHIPFLVW